jgi:hypothetical protein
VTGDEQITVSRLGAGVTPDSFDHSIETLLHDLRGAAIDHHYPERGTADNQLLKIRKISSSRSDFHPEQ